MAFVLICHVNNDSNLSAAEDSPQMSCIPNSDFI